MLEKRMMPGQLIQVKEKRGSKVYNRSGANLARGLEGAGFKRKRRSRCEAMLRDTLLKNWCRGSRLLENGLDEGEKKAVSKSDG